MRLNRSYSEENQQDQGVLEERRKVVEEAANIDAGGSPPGEPKPPADDVGFEEVDVEEAARWSDEQPTGINLPREPLPWEQPSRLDAEQREGGQQAEGEQNRQRQREERQQQREQSRQRQQAQDGEQRQGAGPGQGQQQA